MAVYVDNMRGKPTLTFWLWLIRVFRGQRYMLKYAADHGYDFDRLACHRCYGPGWEPLQ